MIVCIVYIMRPVQKWLASTDAHVYQMCFDNLYLNQRVLNGANNKTQYIQYPPPPSSAALWAAICLR